MARAIQKKNKIILSTRCGLENTIEIENLCKYSCKYQEFRVRRSCTVDQ